jgi:hypothetical protein
MSVVVEIIEEVYQLEVIEEIAELVPVEQVVQMVEVVEQGPAGRDGADGSGTFFHHTLADPPQIVWPGVSPRAVYLNGVLDPNWDVISGNLNLYFDARPNDKLTFLV